MLEVLVTVAVLVVVHLVLLWEVSCLLVLLTQAVAVVPIQAALEVMLVVQASSSFAIESIRKEDNKWKENM